MHRPPVAVVAGALAACLLAACSERHAEPATVTTPAVAPVAAPGSAASASAPAAGNALVAYLHGAEIQAETDGQREALRQALRDLQAMPPAELRAARYAGADGRPARRDLVQVLRAHVVPAAPQSVELEALLADRDSDAGRAALAETLAKLPPPAPR